MYAVANLLWFLKCFTRLLENYKKAIGWWTAQRKTLKDEWYIDIKTKKLVFEVLRFFGYYIGYPHYPYTSLLTALFALSLHIPTNCTIRTIPTHPYYPHYLHYPYI